MPMAKNDKKSFFLNMHPLQRIAISLIVSTIVYFIVSKDVPSLILMILIWDAFAMSYLILSWIVIIKRSVPEIRKTAKKDDGSTVFVFVLF